MGVAVRAGAPKPDISSVDSFKQTLLDAKSVTFVPQGVSGAYVLSVFKRLGISEQMNTKIKPVNVAEHVAEAVAKGEAELALFAANLLVSVPGVEFVGSFPAELQQYFVFTAAIGAGAKQAEPAKSYRACRRHSHQGERHGACYTVTQSSSLDTAANTRTRFPIARWRCANPPGAIDALTNAKAPTAYPYKRPTLPFAVTPAAPRRRIECRAATGAAESAPAPECR
jgi:hypothetical protein